MDSADASELVASARDRLDCVADIRAGKLSRGPANCSCIHSNLRTWVLVITTFPQSTVGWEPPCLLVPGELQRDCATAVGFC